MALKCHSGFVHYNMFHNNHCHGGGNNYGSIFNITNNCGGGCGGRRFLRLTGYGFHSGSAERHFRKNRWPVYVIRSRWHLTVLYRKCVRNGDRRRCRQPPSRTQKAAGRIQPIFASTAPSSGISTSRISAPMPRSFSTIFS